MGNGSTPACPAERREWRAAGSRSRRGSRTARGRPGSATDAAACLIRAEQRSQNAEAGRRRSPSRSRNVAAATGSRSPLAPARHLPRRGGGPTSAFTCCAAAERPRFSVASLCPGDHLGLERLRVEVLHEELGRRRRNSRTRARPRSQRRCDPRPADRSAPAPSEPPTNAPVHRFPTSTFDAPSPTTAVPPPARRLRYHDR